MVARGLVHDLQDQGIEAALKVLEDTRVLRYDRSSRVWKAAEGNFMITDEDLRGRVKMQLGRY